MPVKEENFRGKRARHPHEAPSMGLGTPGPLSNKDGEE